ncbi:hypothetical protein Tco_1540187, partial [Tanacetum coccineum]
HHVSTEKGQDIFMLVEKDYPLTKGLATLMLSNKLRVDQQSEMADELLTKIYNIANKPRKGGLLGFRASTLSTADISLDLSRLATTLNRLERSIQTVGSTNTKEGLASHSKTSKSDTQTSDFNSCESNSSKETLEFVPEPVVVEPKVVSQPKVWFDAPIIEEYESNSDDEYVIQPSKEQEKPSFAFINTVKHVKTPRETIKEQNTYSLSPKADKRDWNGLMSKRMAKQVDLNKNKGKGTSQGENRLVWNNVQRLNHQNKFVPKAVLTKTGIFLVNTARQNLSSQAATTSTARKVNTARPIVNEIRPRNNFYKSHSPIRRPFNRTTAPKANFSNQKVNTVEDNLQRALKNKGIVDSGCSRHMTRNKAYLAEYQDYNGCPVAFGGSKGYLTGKGKMK